jgi:hypothetical protein
MAREAEGKESRRGEREAEVGARREIEPARIRGRIVRRGDSVWIDTFVSEIMTASSTMVGSPQTLPDRRRHSTMKLRVSRALTLSSPGRGQWRRRGSADSMARRAAGGRRCKTHDWTWSRIGRHTANWRTASTVEARSDNTEPRGIRKSSAISDRTIDERGRDEVAAWCVERKEKRATSGMML